MFNKRNQLDKQLNDMLDNPKFWDYYECLIETNKITNLTRITDIDSVYYKHFYDSIVLSKYLDLQNKTLLDVGAGAGFPSIPLKIIEDSLQVTIIDSLNKRIKFLDELVQKLDLHSVNSIHGRAEELTLKNHFDIVTSRAVARLNILIELTLPFVKKGGYFIAYKSTEHSEELKEAATGIEKLGGSIERIETYQLGEGESHSLIFIRKVKEADSKYPRQFAKIKNNPL